ncbi:FOG: WD40 repeat-like protein OS=Pirellula staleyi (strain ATCC 27377 / DSM 6068 / ICPB 4128) GN=Psta_2979 PE=4 SV=1: PQQ_2: PQQ_2 [Gemmata massiliana]|uniref:Pyrrolo-quinoline quinone repeat domain-containing protein n=1 Tax=Gemmata massiliana TaxID=1210884 RepID=A0A6P2DCQ9_9BACT|nr:PQQ-binding-like beta-propeller repeat protein [Gemmata massiliana]VTR98157.1 FOG: WD40 repeat-like protein OS=Pirellula staleyi (strain ATCC 27377 / DSM 6068 / ICPB 4128) GN=Psta_2979 PE=4 SV=1: PQQ_2: PQQ_2 [Gemmata massiliana]
MSRFLAVFALVLCFALPLHAADWPTFLGPTRDGVSTEKGIITSWPAKGLKKVWECELGIGFAPPVTADGRLFHADRFGDNVRLTAREAATGKQLWKYEYPTEYKDIYGYDPGPRACPVVDGDRVYLYGPDGVLCCLNVATGKEVWKVDTKAKYFFHQNFFGAGSVPVIDGDLLILPVGGSMKGPRPVDFRMVKPNGTGLVAFDKKTGAVKYATGDELASYSSPVITTLNGKKTGLYFGRGGLMGFDPQTGKSEFYYPWRARNEESVNASNPVVVGDKVLLTECYGVGGALLDLKGGKLKEVWTDKEKDAGDQSLMCHWNTPIHVNGFVYGSSGRHTEDSDLRCVELATGDVKWRQRRTKRCSLTLVDGHFVSLSEYGDLALIKVNATKYEEVSKYEVPGLEYPCWAAPVVSNGLLYVRGKEKLLALELIPVK